MADRNLTENILQGSESFVVRSTRRLEPVIADTIELFLSNPRVEPEGFQYFGVTDLVQQNETGELHALYAGRPMVLVDPEVLDAMALVVEKSLIFGEAFSSRPVNKSRITSSVTAFQQALGRYRALRARRRESDDPVVQVTLPRE